jgi:hypothetical protein
MTPTPSNVSKRAKQCIDMSRLSLNIDRFMIGDERINCMQSPLCPVKSVAVGERMIVERNMHRV